MESVVLFLWARGVGELLLIRPHPRLALESKLYSDESGDTILYAHSTGDHIRVEGILSEHVILQPTQFVRSDRSHIAIRRKPAPSDRTFTDPLTYASPLPPHPSSSAAAPATLPALIQPEVLVIVDYVNFKAMDFNHTKLGVYLTIFWHAVNTRFALVTDPDLQLRITSVFAITKDLLQPYIKISRVKDQNGTEVLDLDKTLTAIGIYYYKYRNQTMPYFDLAMLMTGEDMADQEKGKWNTNVAGVAPVAGACAVDVLLGTYSNFGLAEDTMPFYTGVLTHAHEVGHLLGATHDGDPPISFFPGHPGALDCPWEDGYLMSYKFGSKNHVRWSQCSIEQFRWMIKSYGRAECLRDVSLESVLPTSSPLLPGQMVQLDEQCEAMFGQSYYNFIQEDRNEVCEKVWCTSDGQHLKSIGPALEGTTCGYTGHKWCQNGECVFKE